MRSKGGFAYLTAEEMAQADRIAIEEFGIDVVVLMENAGLQVGVLARKMLGGTVAGRSVCVVAGKGNNGGDGLVAARHLHNWGAKVTVVLGAEKGDLRDVPAKQLRILEKMGVEVNCPAGGFDGAELLVDALLGYGSKGNPKEPVAGLIRKINSSGIPVLGVDVPSGMDATTGEPGEPCIAANATVTFGLLKTGFLNRESMRFVGELYLADISLPEQIYRKYGQEPGKFGRTNLLKVA
ncbi:MAG TPA: NAD(P)H-hydrate epimerase [Nitrososphaerales archaeon]|nr:NAD(P)H-hydrate epimerase [Nitrososphaerales archaeon]